MGGVLAADGNIYGIPRKSTQVLRFDPRTQQATLVGDQLPGGDWKWSCGVLAADGNIYGIPSSATQVLRLTMPPPDTGPPAAPGDYASGGVSDAPSGVDRLGYTIYAKAVASQAREPESPSTSLCVGIYARWGGGKSFLLTLIQRTLLSLALVETLEKLHEQATALTLRNDARAERARVAAVGAFEKAVAQLCDPKESAMVDEEDKQRFEKQLDEMKYAEAARKTLNGARSRGGVGSLGQATRNLVRFLISVTASCCGCGVSRLRQVMLSPVEFLVSITNRCCMSKSCRLASKHGQGTAGAGSEYAAFSVHEPDSPMGQLEKQLKQGREAKAAEWHAAAVALLLLLPLTLLLLLSPLLMILLFAVLFAVALGRCHKVTAAVGLAVAGDEDADGAVARQAEHRKRVIDLLIGGPDGVGGEWVWRTIGLGEVEQSTISLATMLRYAVLRSAQRSVQLLAFCYASAHSLCASLAACLTCTADDDDTLPEGATKYLVVDFNAWVYSGVRAASGSP
eukprot:scaffold66945_cov67-Phaeocystis_antarctica.AAC.1